MMKAALSTFLHAILEGKQVLSMREPTDSSAFMFFVYLGE